MVTGVAQLHAKLASIPPRLETALRSTIEKAAQQLVAQMKSLVPVDQGKLKASIGYTFGPAPEGSVALGTVATSPRGGIRITIYAGDATTKVLNANGFAFQNARLQEFGTKKMPAQPFFYPVYRANRTRIRAAISRTLNKEIKAIGTI